MSASLILSACSGESNDDTPSTSSVAPTQTITTLPQHATNGRILRTPIYGENIYDAAVSCDSATTKALPGSNEWQKFLGAPGDDPEPNYTDVFAGEGVLDTESLGFEKSSGYVIDYNFKEGSYAVYKAVTPETLADDTLIEVDYIETINTSETPTKTYRTDNAQVTIEAVNEFPADSSMGTMGFDTTKPGIVITTVCSL